MNGIRFRDYPVTVALAAACVAVFAVLEVLGRLQGWALYNAGVLGPFALEQGRWYTLVTSMFMHGGLLHLACNVATLCYIGSAMEDILGPARFAVLYAFSGVVGGLVACGILAAMGEGDVGVVGASGALFGLFGAYAYVLVREHVAPVVLLQAPALGDLRGVAGLLAVNILIGLAPGISMEGHLGGLAAGLVAGIPLYEQLRHLVQRDIDAGLEPPSAPAPVREAQPYDLEAAQAAQDAAMAAQAAYVDEWRSAKPARREDVDRAARDAAMGEGES